LVWQKLNSLSMLCGIYEDMASIGANKLW